jgi:hypothetical protein
MQIPSADGFNAQSMMWLNCWLKIEIRFD